MQSNMPRDRQRWSALGAPIHKVHVTRKVSIVSSLRPNSARTALSRAHSLRKSLSNAQQKAADYILDHPEEVVYASVSDVAERCGASEATVIRVCRSLGFAGFQELKIQLAQSLTTEVEVIHGDLVEADTSQTVLEKTFRASMRALEDSLATIDRKVFSDAVDAILEANRLLFYGVGTSGAVALDANDKFMHTGIPVSAYNDVVLQLQSALTTGRSDVAVGISQSGATQPIVLALRTARENGATTIAITSRRGSPITQVADLNLLVSATEVSVREYVSHELRLAHLSVIDALYLSVALRKRDTYLLNKQRSDQISKRLRINSKEGF